MRLTLHTDFALRLLMLLAVEPGELHTIEEVARRYRISRNHACGESFGQIRTDDAAPWLTNITVGHIFLPTAFFVNTPVWMPGWLVALVWAAFFAGLSLLILPRAKGLLIAILWMTRAPGYAS